MAVLTSRENAILKLGSDSELIRLFNTVWPSIVERLSDESNWSGLLLADAENGFKYERLNYGYDLCLKGKRIYTVGIHLFHQTKLATKWHNHRFPFLIYPLALSGGADVPIYEMEWKDKASGQEGETLVHSGECYAIHRCADVFHRVRSLRNHLSINIADITEPETRPDRLISRSLSAPRTREILKIAGSAIDNSGLSAPSN